MFRLFYDHLVASEEITLELGKCSLEKEERAELWQLADQHLHHRVLDVILRHLPQSKHERFLADFHARPHDKKLLTYLKTEIAADIETKITAEAKKAKEEILAEIRKAKRG
jgi:hypothetical protein